MVAVVVGLRRRRSFMVNHATNMAKLVNRAGDVDRTGVIESVLVLSFLEKTREQGVVHVHHRNNKAPLLLRWAHRDRYASLGNGLHLPPTTAAVVVVVEMYVRHV